MARLNQIIAVEKGVKSRSFQELTDAHQALQKPALLAGIARTYRPKDEEGEQLPPESTKVQVKAEEIIRQTCPAGTSHARPDRIGTTNRATSSRSPVAIRS